MTFSFKQVFKDLPHRLYSPKIAGEDSVDEKEIQNSLIINKRFKYKSDKTVMVVTGYMFPFPREKAKSHCSDTKNDNDNGAQRTHSIG